MPFRLAVHADYLNSPAAPAMCLFSGVGRTNTRQRLYLRQPPLRPSTMVRWLPGLFRPMTPLTVPCAPGAYFRWRLSFWRSYLPVAAGLACAVLVLIFYTNPLNPSLPPLIALGAVVAGGLLTAIFQPLVRRDCIRLWAADRTGQVVVVFPSSREHIFWAYQKGHQQWLESQPPPRSPASPPVPQPAPGRLAGTGL